MLRAGSVVYYFGYVFPHERDAERGAEMKAKQEERMLDASRRCKDDGMRFSADFTRENTDKGTLWDTPEFHFSRKLNTCLVHTRYIVTVYDKLSNQYNDLWDIYGNPNYMSQQFFDEKARLFGE